MAKLKILKNSFILGLNNAVDSNLSKYLRDEPWVEEIGTVGSREMETGVEIKGTLDLQMPVGEKNFDLENAIRVHKALKSLTPLQASDPRLWTRLTHMEFWEYMRKRWGVDKKERTSIQALNFVRTHYFVLQNQSRALLRNGAARLWWTAHLTYDVSRDNPYELTAILLSFLDITSTILERNLGRAPNIITGFLEFLLRRRDDLLKGGGENRARIRQLAKFLNLTGGVCVLDYLSKTEVINMLDTELERSIAA